MTKISNFQLVIDYENIAGFQIMVCGNYTINIPVQIGDTVNKSVDGAVKVKLALLPRKHSDVGRNLGSSHLIC